MTENAKSIISRHLPIWLAAVSIIGWGFTLDARVDAIEQRKVTVDMKIDKIQDDVAEIKADVAYMRGIMEEHE